ncbi:toprim domain-containing protein [Kribbella pittospori]|uniref:Toprim domain-containing protein n=1 Tax=Kribbella pittospori TaxID=722689 RepID=A0A4V2M8N4_9ACTN|nr:toprim domain-containing protein [Kribbella pittospori]TCC52122.1 toprim domain-containing protein [Kribbella pittospori]
MVSDELLHQATAAAARFYWHQLRGRPNGWAVRHLRDRGVADEILTGATSWWLGYAPDTWSGLVDHLRREGFDDQTLLSGGLARATRSGYLIDRFRGRIMFLAEDGQQSPVGFIGRAPGGLLKYLNTPNTPIYTKATTLVGVGAQRHRLSEGAMPVLVEGTMDALAIHQLGDHWAGISPCGTAITREQAVILKQASRLDTVVVAFDGNTAGASGAARSLDVLADVFAVVLAADLPGGHDPSSLFAAHPDRLHDALTHARPLAELAMDVELARWERVLDHAAGKVNAVRAVAPLVARLPAGRVAAQIARLSRRVDLEEQIISREVLAAVGLRREQLSTGRGRTRRRDRLDMGSDPPDLSRTP